MKVAVLGANESSLVALDAIVSRQEHEAFLVLPWGPGQENFRINPSPLNELSFGCPGVQEGVVNFQMLGKIPPSFWPLSRKELYQAGFLAFEGTKPQTSDRRIFESIYDLPTQVTTITWIPGENTLREVLEREFGGVDAIINTEDRSLFCAAEDHQFILTRVWWSNSKGPKIGPGNVIYNAGVEPSWAISSNIDDHTVTIWDRQPPFDDIYTYDLPTRMTCTCETPGIDLHVGRMATYRPIGLAETYEQVVEFLHHPLSKISISGADTQQIAKITEEFDEAVEMQMAFSDDPDYNRCPQCGSDDPAKRLETFDGHINICPNPFHEVLEGE